MNKIIVGTTEIEVNSLRPYAYVNGKQDKFLKIEVSAEVADFETLREILEDTEENIQYYEDEKLICTYVGYGKFEAKYIDGVYTVEMHKNGIVEQMSALLVANEKLNTANATLQETANSLTEQNYILAEQNIMLSSTLSEVLESIIPGFLAEVIGMVGELEARVATLETVTGETVSE